MRDITMKPTRAHTMHTNLYKRLAILLVVAGSITATDAAFGKPRRSEEIAGPEGNPFEDLAPAGGVLIGVKVSRGFYLQHGVIASIQPIYRTADGKTVYGAVHGDERNNSLSAIAKPGYAVGAIKSKATRRINGLRCVFLQSQGNRLTPDKSYEGRWLGAGGPNDTKTIGGDGAPVIGIYGRAGYGVSSIGLIQEPDGVGK